MSTKRRKKKRQRLLTRAAAQRAMFFDFEGTAVDGDPPSVLGSLFRSDAGTWELHQVVIDPQCVAVDRAVRNGPPFSPPTTAVANLLDTSDAERRHLVSWSRHDRVVMHGLTDHRPFRFRNAIPVAKRWAKGAGHTVAKNELSAYENLIGYQRPLEPFGPAEVIRYVRSRSSVTDGARRRWQTLLDHNAHDLLAMRDVVYVALGLEPPDRRFSS